MSHLKGFTLTESLIVISVVSLLTISGLPTLAKAIELERLRTASSALTRSLQVARSTAVVRNTDICIVNRNSSWAAGWQVFVDSNRNCLIEDGEEVLLTQDAMPSSVVAVATLHAKDHILYTASGHSEQLNGGFQADSVYFCPGNNAPKAYRIVVSRGGSIRSEYILLNSTRCIASS